MWRNNRKTWQVRQTQLEVSLTQIERNFKRLKKSAKKANLIVLLKSNAYGQSMEDIARHLDRFSERDGLHGFGVATVEEGIRLRRLGIQNRIYILSGIQDPTKELIRCLRICKLTPVISSLKVLQKIHLLLEANKQKLSMHLKFNTGMNRLGISLADVPKVLDTLESSKLCLEGLMSHYAVAEKPRSSLTKLQSTQMREVVHQFAQAGYTPKYIHMANSAGLANQCFPEANIARVGLHLYGVGSKQVKPVTRWTAQVYQIRTINKGEGIGYGPIFIAPRKMRIAILGVGYGDGYHRVFSNKAHVLIKGKKCRVVGAVSMDLTAVDISRVSGVSEKSHAILLGKDGREEIRVEDLARWANCIPWEILTSISERVPRVIKR